MRFAEKSKHSLSNTKLYLYTFGLLLCLSDLTKTALKWIWYHIAELLIAIAFFGMFIAVEAFDSGAINFTVAIFFVIVLGVLAITLIKLKILESRANKK